MDKQLTNHAYHTLTQRLQVPYDMTDRIIPLNVRLPPDVVKWIDLQVDTGIYNSRSEAIREHLRSYLRRRK